MSSLWQSARLVYRSLESEDESFLETLGLDAEAFTNASPFLPVPQGKKQAAAFREILDRRLLSVVSRFSSTLIYLDDLALKFHDTIYTTLVKYIAACVLPTELLKQSAISYRKLELFSC